MKIKKRDRMTISRKGKGPLDYLITQKPFNICGAGIEPVPTVILLII
jgi:hypothetical protein